jgi:hypothetical protein
MMTYFVQETEAKARLPGKRVKSQTAIEAHGSLSPAQNNGLGID